MDELIKAAANQHGLDFVLVKSIVWAESAGQSKAARYEAHYKYLFDVEPFAKRFRITHSTEEAFQKISWGPMQIMGAAARERGFDGWLPDLCIDYLGLRYGCLHLKWFFDRYKKVEETISAWNAGSPRRSANGEFENQYYVNRVKSFMVQFKGAR